MAALVALCPGRVVVVSATGAYPIAPAHVGRTAWRQGADRRVRLEAEPPARLPVLRGTEAVLAHGARVLRLRPLALVARGAARVVVIPAERAAPIDSPEAFSSWLHSAEL